MVSILAYSWLVFLYPEGSSDIVEIYRNSKGAFDIVADCPSDVLPQGNWLASQDALWRLLVPFEKKEPEVCTLLESMKRWKI